MGEEYNILISAEINSFNEIKSNYLVDINTLEKILACSVASDISYYVENAGDNILNVGADDDHGIIALSIGNSKNTIMALNPSYIKTNDRIPDRDILMSIRTISEYFKNNI